MAEFASLGAGAAQRDGQVAQTSAVAPGGGKREDVSGVILMAEIAVEAAEFGIAGDQRVEGRTARHLFLKTASEAFDGRAAQSGGNATERDATAFGGGHGDAQACGAVSVGGISTWTSPFPFSAVPLPVSAGGSASFRENWRPAPMASLYRS